MRLVCYYATLCEVVRAVQAARSTRTAVRAVQVARYCALVPTQFNATQLVVA
jgi:hypothetical protein